MYLVRYLTHYIFLGVVFLLIYLVGNCAHIVGGFLWNVIEFNGAEANCGIAHILGILLTNSSDF